MGGRHAAPLPVAALSSLPRLRRGMSLARLAACSSSRLSRDRLLLSIGATVLTSALLTGCPPNLMPRPITQQSNGWRSTLTALDDGPNIIRPTSWTVYHSTRASAGDSTYGLHRPQHHTLRSRRRAHCPW